MVDAALRSVSELLPASWSLRAEADGRRGPLRADALAVLTGPDGTAVRFAVESKASGVSVGALLPRLREMTAQRDLPILFVSDYVGSALREALAAEGFSYADVTGWVRVSTTSPLILLTGRGADRSPRVRSRRQSHVSTGSPRAGSSGRSVWSRSPSVCARSPAVRGCLRGPCRRCFRHWLGRGCSTVTITVR